MTRAASFISLLSTCWRVWPRQGRRWEVRKVGKAGERRKEEFVREESPSQSSSGS